MAQKPEATMIHSLEHWNKLGRSVKAQETGIKVRVSAPYEKDGRKLYGYKVGRAFDVSQTTGRDMAEKLPLAEEPSKMDMALRSLIRMSPVPVRTTDEIETDAVYKPKDKVIKIRSDLSDAESFAALGQPVV